MPGTQVPPPQGTLDMFRMPTRAYSSLWRWLDNGWTDERATDGWIVCLYVRLIDRIGG